MIVLEGTLGIVLRTTTLFIGCALFAAYDFVFLNSLIGKINVEKIKADVDADEEKKARPIIEVRINGNMIEFRILARGQYGEWTQLVSLEDLNKVQRDQKEHDTEIVLMKDIPNPIPEIKDEDNEE